MDSIVFFPTNNIGKYDRYKRSFEKIGMQYERYYISSAGKEVKVDVKEDGESLIENACKKAKAYYDEYSKYLPNEHFSIITTDEALYFDGLRDEEQPGMFVRRFNGLDSNRATDDEVVQRYTEFVKMLGGKAHAKWVYSLVMYDGKQFREYTWEEEVWFSDTPHYPITKGYVLNNITFVDNNDSNIMLSDLTDDERYEYLSHYTDSIAAFVKEGMSSEALGNGH